VRGVAAKYLFEYKIGRRKPKQQWMGVGWANKLFGTDVVREQVTAFRATIRHASILAAQVKEQVAEPSSSPLALFDVCLLAYCPVQEVNEYESERLRNIQKNQELMRNLGLAE
jgi:hypothetical protein